MGPKRTLSERQGIDQEAALDSSVEDPALTSMEVVMNPLAAMPCPASPFSFDRRRLKIDWRLLHGVDVDRVVRETDLDLLEKVVSMAVYGDLEAEDPEALSPLNFGRICRVAQLTGEYLLHVQDRLALENSQLKEDRLKASKYNEALRLRIKEQRESGRENRRELRRAQRSLRAYEGQVTELKAQREALLTEIRHLKGDMQAANAQVFTGCGLLIELSSPHIHRGGGAEARSRSGQ
ncbi:hypothetical protein WJX84_004962 [Apatococcus fuscideae]|uniref:Cilium assembly protein DZIP1 N-terminal domain-containing protein n=1 Tax=Apatococcus fuscideae TaxID=2026836 RepID=A0AAW1SJH8_9CHLO